MNKFDEKNVPFLETPIMVRLKEFGVKEGIIRQDTFKSKYPFFQDIVDEPYFLSGNVKYGLSLILEWKYVSSCPTLKSQNNNKEEN